MNLEKSLIKKINSLTLVTKNNPENADDQLTKISSLEKEHSQKRKLLNKDKWFWETFNEPTCDRSLAEFLNLSLPSELTYRIDQKLQKLDLYGINSETRLAIKASVETEEMSNWIKADLIVNKERNNSLNGIKEGVSSLISENKEITQRINDREEKITKNTKEIKRLEHSLTILRENNNDLNNKSVDNLKFYQQTLKDLENNKAELEFKINNIPSTANNLISQVKIAEYEAYLANRDKILTLEQNKLIMNEKELLEIKIKDLEIERDCLLTKYQNDFSFYQMDIRENEREITKLENDLEKHQLALADAGKQLLEIEQREDAKDQEIKQYIETIQSLSDELQGYTTISAKTNRFIGNLPIFNQLGNKFRKIFLFLTLLIGILIGYFFSKLFSKKPELKIKVEK